MEEVIKQEEVVKFISGMTGKYSYEIRLLGKPEDNIERIKYLKKELNIISDKKEVID